MTTVGAIFRPSNPPELALEVARAADAAGLAELWLWEDCFAEGGLTTATAMLASTERLKVGIGLLPVPLRNVAITAMELATVERLFPGRLIPGFGHGVLNWMGQVGARVESPMTLLREHLTALRTLLSGAELSTEGRYVRLDRVKLEWPPVDPMPLHAGGVKPKTLQLCGELADATIITGGTTPDELRAACQEIERGRQAGRRAEAHRVSVFVMAATGPDADQRLRGEADRWGFPPDADVGVAGSAEQIAAGLQKWIEAGADAVLLQPVTGQEDLPGYVRFVAEQVQPLLA